MALVGTVTVWIEEMTDSVEGPKKPTELVGGFVEIVNENGDVGHSIRSIAGKITARNAMFLFSFHLLVFGHSRLIVELETDV